MFALFIQSWMTVLAILIRRRLVYKKRKDPNFLQLHHNVQLGFSALDVTSHVLCTTILYLVLMWGKYDYSSRIKRQLIYKFL